MSNTSSYRLARTPESNADAAGAQRLPAGDALIGALVAAASALCESSPRLAECRVLAYRDSLPPGLIGSYVPVIDGDSSIHVGILSDACSCDALAWLIDDSAAHSALRTRSALSELTQRLAAGLSRRSETGAPLAVGAPVFIDGIARRTRGACVRAVEVAFGVTRATLVVVGSEALVQSDWPRMDKPARAHAEGEEA
jgi:hypothetical protein